MFGFFLNQETIAYKITLQNNIKSIFLSGDINELHLKLKEILEGNNKENCEVLNRHINEKIHINLK